MEEFLKILLNALPEALGALIATGIIALLSYLFVKRLKKEIPQTIRLQELPSEPPKPEIYSNLPPRTEFIGREREKRLVIEALNSRWPLVCIDGIGGIGKTSLALEVVHECLWISKDDDESLSESKTEKTDIPKFDGIIWTTAKDRELKLNDILDAVARTLDWPGIAQQPVEDKLESVRKLLQTKRYLLIVDNFETITDETIRDFLLKIPEPSKALITCREQKLHQAWAVSIKGLEQDEALTLIRNEGRRLGLKALQEAEDQVLFRLYQATGGAPLALKWAVGQIKQKGQSLDTVLAALHEAKGDIFEEVYARSWSLLTGDARKVLMVMPIFASSASKDAIEAANDVHHFALDEALGQLVQMWMVEVTNELEESKKRYSVHPLTRIFAETHIKQDKVFEKSVQKRIVEWFLKFVKKNGGYENWKGYQHLEVEIENIFGAFKIAYYHERWNNVMEFYDDLWYFLGTKGYWEERLRLGYQAIRAAEILGNRLAIAEYGVHAISWILIQLDKYEEAMKLSKRSLHIFRERNDVIGVAVAKVSIGEIALRRNKSSEAEKVLNEALNLFERFDTTNIKLKRYSPSAIHALTFTNLAILSFRQNDYKKAQSYHQKALEIAKKANLKAWIALAIGNLGYIAYKQDNFNKAKQLCENALNMHLKLGRYDYIAIIKKNLGFLEEAIGNYKKALSYLLDALEIYERLGRKKKFDQIKTKVEQIKNMTIISLKNRKNNHA